MKILKFTPLAFGVGMFFSSGLIAQTDSDTLKMDVTFVGEREMVVKDALKLQSWPEPRSLDNTNRDFTYRLLSKRLNVSPQWTLVEPVRLKVDAPLSRLYRGYITAGYGLHNTPLLNLSLTDLRSREGTWGIKASHFATNTPVVDVEDRYQESQGGVWASRFIGKEKVDLSLNVNRNNIVYYGRSFENPIENDSVRSERYLTIGSDIAFKSHYRDSTKLNHEVNFGWGMLSDLSGTLENNFEGDFTIGKFVETEKYTLTGSINFDRLTIGEQNPNNQSTDQVIVGIEPMVTTYKGPLTVTAGAGIWVDADPESRNDGQNFYFYPKVDASIRLLKDIFVPYLRIGGGLEQNRFESVLQKNPFFYVNVDEHLKTTSRKADIQLGLRGTITNAMSFQVHARTVKYDNYIYFYNDSSMDGGSRFSILYDTLGINTFGGDLSFVLSKSLRAQLSGSVHKYSKQLEDENNEAWNLPKYQASIDIDYSFLEKFSIKLSTQFVGERYGMTGILQENQSPLVNGNYKVNLPSYIDANIGLEYRYTSRTAVWMNLNNITGSQYKHWDAYPNQGFQALFGASYLF